MARHLLGERLSACQRKERGSLPSPGSPVRWWRQTLSQVISIPGIDQGLWEALSWKVQVSLRKASIAILMRLDFIANTIVPFNCRSKCVHIT